MLILLKVQKPHLPHHEPPSAVRGDRLLYRFHLSREDTGFSPRNANESPSPVQPRWGIQVMHRRLLTGEAKLWYLHDVGLPSGISILVFGVSRYVFPDSLPPVPSLIWIIITTLFASALSLSAMPHTRAWVRGRLQRDPNLPAL